MKWEMWALNLTLNAMHASKLKSLLCFLLLAVFVARPAPAEQSASLILSRGIIPYHKAAEGVKSKLPEFRFKEYILEDGPDQGQALLRNLEKEPPSLIVTVGPEATHLVKGLSTTSIRVFTMILNPEKIFSDTLPFPGVSMNYPPRAVLSFLQKAFPERKKVGIFFSPHQNAELIELYEKEGQTFDMAIQSFPILSAAEIRSAVQAPHFAPDLVLFVPDPFMIKEKLVDYVVEECLFRKIPAVGFNTWFAKSGAVMALYLDYEEVGWQTANLALQLVEDRGAKPLIRAPENLKVILNLKIARKFNLEISEEIRAAADQVIE